MTVELRAFHEIVNASPSLIAEPRSFKLMHERLKIQENIAAQRALTNNVRGQDDMNRRAQLDQLIRRQDALKVTPGERATYIDAQDYVSPIPMKD